MNLACLIWRSQSWARRSTHQDSSETRCRSTNAYGTGPQPSIPDDLATFVVFMARPPFHKAETGCSCDYANHRSTRKCDASALLPKFTRNRTMLNEGDRLFREFAGSSRSGNQSCSGFASLLNMQARSTATIPASSSSGSVIVNATVARDQLLNIVFGQQTSVTCGCRIGFWQSGVSSSGRRWPSIDMKEGYGISKEYLGRWLTQVAALTAVDVRCYAYRRQGNPHSRRRGW